MNARALLILSPRFFRFRKSSMDKFIEFATNHPLLVASFVGLWLLFFFMESKRSGRSVSAQIVTNLVNRHNGLVVDLRSSEDFREGHIPGSMNLPMDKLIDHIEKIKTHQDKPVVLVCNAGTNATAAGRQLQEQGFSQVYRLAGGMQSWRGDNLPVVKS